MARSSILGADPAPVIPAGRDVEALGPSDTSDSGSDVQGGPEFDDGLRQEIQHADSDTGATGERASAVLSQDARDGGDIAPDRIIGGDADEPIGANVSDDEDTDDEAGEEDERADF